MPYLSARLDFPSPSLSAPGSPRMYYLQFTGPLLLTIVGETFVFASVEECRSVLKTYWWVVHSNLPVNCTLFCLFLWPHIRSQSERANWVIPRSPSLFLHITRRVVSQQIKSTSFSSSKTHVFTVCKLVNVQETIVLRYSVCCVVPCGTRWKKRDPQICSKFGNDLNYSKTCIKRTPYYADTLY